METDQTKMTTSSAPLAVGPVDDDVERMRRQYIRVLTPEEEASRAEQQRWFNSKKNADEIAACRQYLTVFQENNRHLAAVGLVPLNFPTPPEWRDLNLFELRTHLTVLGRLTREQVDALNRHEAEAAEAQWQNTLAAETPVVRWLIEQLEAARADIAELQAERSARNRETVRAEPVRPKAMSGMSIATGSGLCAEVSIPPSAARPDPSAARRITSR
jgi:hypothetical protein